MKKRKKKKMERHESNTEGKKGGFGAPSLCVSLGVVALNAKLGAVSQAATTNARRGDFFTPFSLTLSFFLWLSGAC